MNNLQRKAPIAKSSGLPEQPCSRCGRPVLWCRFTKAGRGGLRPVAIDVVEDGQGNVGLSSDLFSGTPYAYELTSTRSRYRLHGPACSGPASFTRVGGGKSK